MNTIKISDIIIWISCNNTLIPNIMGTYSAAVQSMLFDAPSMTQTLEHNDSMLQHKLTY